MSKIRILFIVMFIAFSAMNAGCGKENEWFNDFTDSSADVNDWIFESF